MQDKKKRFYENGLLTNNYWAKRASETIGTIVFISSRRVDAYVIYTHVGLER